MTPADAALWHALQPLRSVSCWLMLGAHPDDEWNGFLAWLALGQGVHTVYACATRGEGGQNASGPERGRLLGAIRSREMERAAAEIGLTLVWLGAGTEDAGDDPIHDFGFSKSGDDTQRRWDEARLLTRMVHLIREQRPDAVSPTFLDVPGQHGHHRAVTRGLLHAVTLAADPSFTPHLPPWQVQKIYLPAFSGAGGSYDDEVPPPPETTSVDLGEVCPPLAATWAQIGERSRRHHASQGMGRDLPSGPRPLRLHRVGTLQHETSPLDGLPHRLADLLPDFSLREADTAIAEALAAFPHRPAVAAALHRAVAVTEGLALPPDIAPRLTLKRRQLARATATLTVQGPATARLHLPSDWTATTLSADRHAIHIPAEATPFGTNRPGWDPLGGNGPLGATLRWTHAGSTAELRIDPDQPLSLAPATETRIIPTAVVRRSASQTPATIEVIGAPAPWPIQGPRTGTITLDIPPGRHALPEAGARLITLRLPQAGNVTIVEPARVTTLRAPIAIDPAAIVGVIAGDTDETLAWLQQLDIEAEPINDATLATGDLTRFTTLLIGVFGFGQRPTLQKRRPQLIEWIEAGGSLVTLYHRPGDGWHDGNTPPRHIRIGTPSFRWRVTDPDAPVTLLAPDHPLLNHPNALTPEDWTGWVRERGLYFASDWDPAYTPILALSDPGENPLKGALLAANIGRGRHIHTALALHHQFSALVPGAFRLLANLLARATDIK